MIKGLEEPIEIFEVGVAGLSPLRVPENTEKARSAVAAGEEVTLGWRPAAGIEIPYTTYDINLNLNGKEAQAIAGQA